MASFLSRLLWGSASCFSLLEALSIVWFEYFEVFVGVRRDRSLPFDRAALLNGVRNPKRVTVLKKPSEFSGTSLILERISRKEDSKAASFRDTAKRPVVSSKTTEWIAQASSSPACYTSTVTQGSPRTPTASSWIESATVTVQSRLDAFQLH